MKQIVTKYASRKFHLSWLGVRNSDIRLNFNPLVENFNLYGNNVLVHWQARPFGLRRFGLYDIADDVYYGCDCDKVEIDYLKSSLVQIPENRVEYRGILPTAMICYYNAKIQIDDDGYIIRDVIGGSR